MKRVLMAIVLLMIALGAGAAQESEAEALRVLDDFMAAFNNQDYQATTALFHYPHIRIVGGRVLIWKTQEEAIAARSPAVQKRFLKETGWHRSAWENLEVIHSSDDKVHIAVRFTRYREDGSVIGTYNSFYIVTKQEGSWGIQARSSYVPPISDTD
jgi:hypothetical protein